MAKQEPLVLQHLEDISGGILDMYPNLIRELIRGRTGVYALYKNSRLYYIGLAKDLRGRLKTHLKDRHKGYWNRFSVYLTVNDNHVKELESLMVRVLMPRGNRAEGKFTKSLNLRPHLKKLMKDYDADRRARLMGGEVARQRQISKLRKRDKKLPLAGAVERSVELRATYNEQKYRATLRRDGKIRLHKKIFDSPTGAAHAATGQSINGWALWQYRNDKGKWVPLSEMRG